MVYQSFNDDCGKACVRNILNLLFKDDRYKTAAIRTSCENFLQIKEELESYNCYFEAYKTESIKDVEKRMFPCICQISNFNKTHFVVVKKCIFNRVYLLDPEFGEYSLSISEFNQIFLHNVLLKKEIKEKVKCPKFNFFRPFDYLFYVLFMLGFLSSSLIFFYLINQKDSYFLLCVDLLVFLFLLFAIYVFNDHLRKRLDKTIYLPFLKKTNNEDDAKSLNIVLNEKIKKINYMIFYGSASVILIIFIMFNSLFFSILVLLSLLCSLINLAYEKRLNYVRRKCAMHEMYFLTSLKEQKMVDKYYLESRKTAYDYKTINVFIFVLEMLILGSFLLINMSISNNYSINYLLFYLFSSFTLMSLFTRFSKSFLDDSIFVKEMNKLSSPLNDFNLKTEKIVSYNKRT